MSKKKKFTIIAAHDIGKTTIAKEAIKCGLPVVSNSAFNYNAMKEQTNEKVAIRKGCQNQQCFCTGACQEIIGWRDKLQNEH
jgi:hypothetical protein